MSPYERLRKFLEPVSRQRMTREQCRANMLPDASFLVTARDSSKAMVSRSENGSATVKVACKRGNDWVVPFFESLPQAKIQNGVSGRIMSTVHLKEIASDEFEGVAYFDDERGDVCVFQLTIRN